MLAHCKELMEYQNRYVAILPDTDKEATSHDDLFDAFRMSLQFWH